MTELTPAVADALAQASEAISALRKTRPANIYQARAKSAEMIRIQREIADVGQRAAEANAEQRIASANGHANGHAHRYASGDAEGDATGLSDEVVSALAASLVPFVRTVVAEALAPRDARLDEIERVLRSLVESAARHDG
jgi:flagellar biosynthesis/type III secretory pathway protein FliH